MLDFGGVANSDLFFWFWKESRPTDHPPINTVQVFNELMRRSATQQSDEPSINNTLRVATRLMKRSGSTKSGSGLAVVLIQLLLERVELGLGIRLLLGRQLVQLVHALVKAGHHRLDRSGFLQRSNECAQSFSNASSMLANHSIGLVLIRAADFSVKSGQAPRPDRQALVEIIWGGTRRS